MQGSKCSGSHRCLQWKTSTSVMHSYPCVAKNVIHIKIPLASALGNCYTNTYKLLLCKIGFVLQKLLCIPPPQHFGPCNVVWSVFNIDLVFLSVCVKQEHWNTSTGSPRPHGLRLGQWGHVWSGDWGDFCLHQKGLVSWPCVQYKINITFPVPPEGGWPPPPPPSCWCSGPV